MLVRQHDVSFADLDFGVAHAAIWTGQPHGFHRAERAFVELDGVRRAFDGQVRRDPLETLWDWFDCVWHTFILPETNGAGIVKN